jgi:hypothetical protein
MTKEETLITVRAKIDCAHAAFGGKRRKGEEFQVTYPVAKHFSAFVQLVQETRARDPKREIK